MKTRAGYLTYCSNIHSGESWKDHFNELQRYFPSVKTGVSAGQAMGIGLRLSNQASIDLLLPENLSVFKIWLKEQNGYVFTMNGFPYGEFHDAVVKDQVHAPDWTSMARVEYTSRLFEILSELLPSGMEGSISTSPLSYKYWFENDAERIWATRAATQNILHILEKLITLHSEQEQILHLDIEPEPDGLLESGEEFIDWYMNCLIPMANELLQNKLGMTEDELVAAVKKHICLCYDVCHFAIGYENHAEVLEQLNANGIKVGKIQISAALKAELPTNGGLRNEIKNAFSAFNEPTYLHQVVGKNEDGSLVRYRDLPDALTAIGNDESIEWRAHFHVPIFNEDLGLLKSTKSDIAELLKLQVNNPFTSHLEVETYTWDVLPEELKKPIEESIIRELQWVISYLESYE